MLAKLSLVFGFCFFSIIIATLTINIAVYFLNPMMSLFETPVKIQDDSYNTVHFYQYFYDGWGKLNSFVLWHAKKNQQLRQLHQLC